jgi:hypothetical protein
MEGMNFRARPRRIVVVSILSAVLAGLTLTAAPREQDAATKPATPKGSAVIRGCLTGGKLIHIEPIEPQDHALKIPDNLKVGSLRVLRDQVKGLDGHQVEIIGTLRGIPGMDQGVPLTDSQSSPKVYIGGADKNLGEDLHPERSEPPTIYAKTIKDLAPECESKKN